MSAYKEFLEERVSRIEDYAEDGDFIKNSSSWLEESMRKKYVYNFDWLDRPIIQYPQDMVAMQEIIWKTRPDVVIETGIAHGGSLILSASILALLDVTDAKISGELLDPTKPKRHVVGVDIDIREHNRIAIEAHPLSDRIHMIEGSSIDPKIVDEVKQFIKPESRVMVCLDSMHTHEHVLSELKAYAPLVTEGCYCIVFDTFVEDMPNDLFPDRPWSPGDNPKTAVHKFLENDEQYSIDKSIQDKLLITVAPDGFLQKIK
jgi:cephalosporin hydroxylase